MVALNSHIRPLVVSAIKKKKKHKNTKTKHPYIHSVPLVQARVAGAVDPLLSHLLPLFQGDPMCSQASQKIQSLQHCLNMTSPKYLT